MTTNKIPTDEEIVQRGLLRRGGHLYFENLIWIAEQARAAGRAEGRKAGMEEAAGLVMSLSRPAAGFGPDEYELAADAIRAQAEDIKEGGEG